MFVTDKNYPSEETFFYYGYIYNGDKVTSVEEIKAINGDYCGVLCKDDCVIAVTDPFRSKILYYNVDPEYRTFVFSHDPRDIQRMDLYPYTLEENTIVTLDLHTFKISKQPNMILSSEIRHTLRCLMLPTLQLRCVGIQIEISY
jgi:hypothetical protein